MKSELQGEVITWTGGTLAWWRDGSGPPLLVLNGGPGSPSRYLHGFVSRLARQWTACVFDQPGTGASTVPSLDADHVGVNAIVAAAEALRRHLGIARWHVLGHSFGAMVAMQYACDHPDAVASLVLTGPGGADTQSFAYLRDNVRARLYAPDRTRFDALLEASRAGSISAAEELELDALFGRASTFFPERAAATDEDPEGRIDRRTSEVVWRSLREAPFDLKPRLGEVRCPVAIVAGRQDYVGEAVPLTLERLLPRARLRFLDRCGHRPWLDQPEAFAALLAIHLEEFADE